MFALSCARRPKYLLLFAILLTLALTAVPAQCVEAYQFETAEPKASAQLPQGTVDQLEPKGALLYTYSNGLRVPFCEVFWARAVSLQDARQQSNRITYRDLKPGSFLGVIHFLPEAGEEFREDFHDQKLSPGYYTMRYAVTSDADVHDVVMLSPATRDGDAGLALSVDQLMHLGRMASGTERPAVMSLVPAEINGKDSPSVRTADDGTCILQVKLHVAPSSGLAKEFDLAIILVKPIPDSEGS
jgi:hypothetical protein